jgi:hypothetical protein
MPCPPHSPLLVEAVVAGEAPCRWVASCLAYGLAGPEREDGWEAKLAFEETSLADGAK